MKIHGLSVTCFSRSFKANLFADDVNFYFIPVVVCADSHIGAINVIQDVNASVSKRITVIYTQ